MPLSRRGLFGVLAGAPAAAVGMVALPAKGGSVEPSKAEIAELFIKVDTTGLDDFVRVVARDAACRVIASQPRPSSEAQGDWRPAR